MAGDYGDWRPQYVYTVYTVYVSCHLYYIIKMEMMGMVLRKKNDVMT